MYTTINEWKKHLIKSGKINEMFDEDNMPDFVPMPDDNDDTFSEETQESTLTIESFTEALINEINLKNESLEEGQEPVQELTAEQIECAFNVCKSLCSTQEEIIEDSEDEFEDEFEEEEDLVEEKVQTKKKNVNNDNEEIVEEALGNFFRGGSKEEIQQKEKELTAQLDKLYNDATNKKYTVLFKDTQNLDNAIPFDKNKALSFMKKNNFLGSLKPVVIKDKVVITYTPGKKGLAKLASGSSSQTAGK